MDTGRGSNRGRKGERGRAPHLEGRGPRWGCGDLGIPEERKRAVATQRRDSGEIGLRERRAEIANENDSRGLICSCHRSTLSTFNCKTASNNVSEKKSLQIYFKNACSQVLGQHDPPHVQVLSIFLSKNIISQACRTEENKQS